MSLRILTAADVRVALPMTDAINAMREAFSALATGRADVPLRSSLQPAGTRTVSLTMPGAMTMPLRMGAKLLTLNEDNPRRGLPVIHGLVVMFDHQTGEPAGLIEGMSLTAMRTGAVSGLATEFLAPRDATSVAIVGAGAQAPLQLEAVAAVRNISSARVWSRTFARAEKMAKEVQGKSGFPDRVVAVTTIDEAVDGADIICTATPSPEPLISTNHMRPGLHINAIGSYTPYMKEIAPGVVSAARVVVDDRDAAMAESGELRSAVQGGLVEAGSFVELGDLVEGRVVGRRSADEVTLFKSVGLAVQDLSAGGWALDRATRLGIGTELDLGALH